MAVDTTLKTGYWRINPATGEREWIEQSNQPKQPKLKDEQIGAAGPPKLYTGTGEEAIVAPVSEEEITPVRPISPLITSRELYELDTAWGSWWDQYAQTGKFPAKPTEETLKPYYEQWVQAATKWETDNPPPLEQAPPVIDTIKLTESANLYGINDKDFVTQAQLVDLSKPFEDRTLNVPFEQYLTWEQARWLGYDVPEGSVVKVVPVVGGAPQLYVLPDPEAISRVMAELARPREDLIKNLRDIYPRMFDPANSWGYSNDEIPDMVISSLQRWMADDYAGFVEDLFDRVGEVEGEKILRMFGVTEESILITLDVKEQEARVNTLITDVFPDFKTAEQLNTLIEEDWNLFVETIQWKGATSEKRRLLELLGYNPDDINSFFNVIRVIAPVDGVRQEITIDTQLGKAYDRNGVWVGTYNVVTHEFTDLPDESFAKDTWDALVYAGQHLYHQSKQFLVSALPNFLFRDTYQWERDLYGDDYADKVDAGNKRLRDNFRQVYNLNQSEFERWEAANPQLAPPEFAQENIVDRLKDNPLKTIIYEFASTAPFMLAVMGTTIGVTAATGNPLLGVTAGAAVATPPQSQDAYDALLAAGATERQAGLLALPIGLTMSAIESIGDMPYLKKVFPTIFKMVSKEALDQVGKMTLASLLKKGLTTFTMIEITETIEEVLQDAVLNAGIRTFNENQAIFEGLEDTILRTLAATAPLALFGAGASLRRVTGVQTRGFTDAQLRDKGYLQDPKTGNWYQTLKDALKDEGGFVIPGEFFGGEEVTRGYNTQADKDAHIANLEKQISEADKSIAEKSTPEKITQRENIQVELKKAKETPVKISVPEIPVTEAGQPEAGLQPSMIPGAVPDVVVRPKGKGKIVQISMEDQLKLNQAREAVEAAPDVDAEAYEAHAQAEGIRVSLETDPIAQKQIWIGVSKKGKPLYRGLDFFISLREQSFPNYFTVKQAKLLNPHADFSKYEQKGLKTFNKVPRDEALDWMASELGVESAEEIAERVMEIRADKSRLKELEASITTHYTETPLPAVPEVTRRQSVTNERTAGNPTLTPAQVKVTLDLFGKYIENPDAIRSWELTRNLRSEARTTRAELLKARAQELIVDKGVPVEEAMNQAINETMTGELPAMTTDYLSDLTENMRNVLFNKVYQTLEGEPYEMMSTSTALTNALLGKAIPRDPGTTGRSAFTRLQRVFGDQPKVLKAIEKMTEEHKPLEDIVEGIYHEINRPPIPIDQDMANYLRNLKDIPNGYRTLLEPEFNYPRVIDTRSSIDLAFAKTELELSTMLAKGEIDEDAYKLARAEARSIAYPTAPPTRYDPPIQDAIEQIPLWPKPIRDDVIKVLKEIGMSPIDIGNFLRANKASFDFSFWRQQAPLIASHPVAFAQANVDAWKALWSQKSAEASWEKITRDYLYQIYEVCAEKGGDFLRPLELKKGTAQWRGTEEFGYLTQDRVIPKLTSKLPWVKISARAFETGTNSHNWLIFKGYYKGMLELSQQYASGKKVLPVGQAFDIEKEMVDFSKMLANFTARGSLGRAAQLAPALSSGFFAPRATIGRILSVKDLVNPNPRVRRQAWINASTFVGTVGGIILLGAAMGLWSVEKDPRSAEYMSIRIGNTRIDPWGGYRQFFVFFTRCITGTGVSSVTGAEYEINPLMAVTNFVRGKGSPLASIISDFWTGKTFVGEEVDITSSKQWIERFAPFAVWDIYEAYMEDPATAMAAAIPAIVGAGVQTYTGDWVENWPKLGLPKFSDNLQYGLTEPYYDTADFWTDTSSQFAGVDPATLTAQKGYPDYIRAIVEARVINEYIRTLPTQKLIALNADPNSGETTFAQYYKMWQDRKKIVATGDEDALKAFDQDERTRNAHLGNFSQTQFALLNQYWAITDKREQAAFLDKHKASIGVNPRQDWLRSHPNENARLAVWGQAKILTKEAYTEFNRLIKELDIPATAIPELTLPPESSIDTHFDYEAMVDDGTHSSVEARLLLLKDHIAAEEAGVQSYVDWRNESGNPLELSDKTVEYLQLRFDNQTLFDDLEEALAIPIKEERDAAVEAIRATKVGDETFHDIERRVEVMGKGTREAPVPEELVNDYVNHMGIVDETSGNSAEAKLNRYDNENLNGFLMDEDVWGKQKASPLHEDKFLLDNYYVPVWRYDVKYRLEDGEYNELPEDDRAGREDYLSGAGLSGEALNRRLEYAADRRRREALELTNTITGDRFPLEQVEKFVEYYELEAKGMRQERFLVNNPEFAQAMHDIKGIDIPKAEDVPAIQFDDIYDLNREDFEKLEGLSDYESEFYIEDPEERAVARDAMRFTPDGKYTEFGISELTRNAYGALVPEQFVEAYVGYYKIIGEGKPKNWKLNSGTDLWYEDDWFLMENMGFYTSVYKGILGNEARDFTKIPSREVFDQYLTYISLPHLKAKDDYRWDNRELDAWLVLKFDYTPIAEKIRRAELTTYERFIEDWDLRGKAIEEKLKALRGE